MISTGSIVGCGELIYDHVFVASPHSLTYYGSRGGGSVFNLLANIAVLGGRASAVGVAGNDIFGDAARDELQTLGVKTDNVISLPRRKTRIIFENLVEGGDEERGQRYSFGTTCLVCNSKPPEKQLASLENIGIEARDVSSVRFLCFDKLTRARTRTALDFLEQGVTTVLDLGRLGHLRYVPAAEIVAALSAFQIVFLPTGVAESLSRRLGLSIDEIFRTGPRRLMLVSHGPSGMSVFDRMNPKTVTTLRGADCANVIDDAGAGDTFLARAIWGLAHVSKRGDLSNVSHDTVIDITVEAIGSLGRKLGSYGARGHIAPEVEISSPVPRAWRGLDLGEIRSFVDRDDACPFCGSSVVSNSKAELVRPKNPGKRGAKANASLLFGRVMHALERKEAIEECRKLLRAKGTSYAIGTGGSFTVAAFLANVLNTHGGLFTQAIRPFDYIRSGRQTDYVFAVTYSGSTEDCSEAISHARDVNARHVVLVTGAADPKLRTKLNQDDTVISLGRETKERGFISMAATVTPCALWTAAVIGIPEMVRFAARVEGSAVRTRISEIVANLVAPMQKAGRIAVFGGGLAWPAMIDLESKFVEGGVGTLQLHEVKDFSHGRFISLSDEPQSKKTPILVLSVGKQTPYEEYLASKFRGLRRVECLSSESDGLLGSLELLIWIQYLAQEIGAAVGRDISRPSNIPSSGLSLYKWNRGLK